jgi:hypothetical protein
LGILGIENRKPKIVSLFPSQQQLPKNTNLIQILKYFFLFKNFFLKYFFRIRANSRGEGEGGGEGGGEGREGEGGASARMDFYRIRRINTDAGGRPEGNFHPKTSVMTSLMQRGAWWSRRARWQWRTWPLCWQYRGCTTATSRSFFLTYIYIIK